VQLHRDIVLGPRGPRQVIDLLEGELSHSGGVHEHEPIGVVSGPVQVGSDPAKSFTGSYDLNWEIVGYDDGGNPVIEFHLDNASTRSSAPTNPLAKYPDGGGSAANGMDAEPGERWAYQSVRWRETVTTSSTKLGTTTFRTYNFVDHTGTRIYEAFREGGPTQPAVVLA
jgi:hypothetical protein